MKELSVEEKARRYDEAIEKLRSLHDDYDTVSTLIDVKEELENIFPELKESGDERTWIINYLSNRILNSTIIAEKENLKKAIAWLEKQGSQILANSAKTCKDEQKPAETEKGANGNEREIPFSVWSEEDKKMFVNIKACLRNANKDYSREVDWLKSIKPQPKNEWSEEDESNRRTALMLLRYPITIWSDVNNNTRIKIIDWLKSLEDKYISQQKQDWSEKDEERRKKIIHILSLDGRIKNEELSDINDWLKFLKERYTWKPSDEQMKAIKDAIDYLGCNTKKVRDYLMSLYEQLKKLREE